MHVTAQMDKDKWRSLKKSYTNVKDNKAKSGAGTVRFEYYQEMDDLIGKKPNNEPMVTFSSEDGAPELQGKFITNIDGKGH